MSQARLEREERSSSRFAGVTRVAFRAVIVAGFAGAVWTMSATAASAAADQSSAVSAAKPAGAPLTSSVLTLVDNVGSAVGSSADPITESVLTPVSDTVKPLLGAGGGVLSQVLAPTNTVLSHIGTGNTVHTGTGRTSGLRHAAGTASATAAPDVALVSPANQATSGATVRPHDAALTDEGGNGSPDLLRTVANLVAPLGLDQILQPTLDVIQPVVGVIDPLTAPFDQLLSPVTGVVDDVATPIFDALGPVIGSVDEVVAYAADGSADGSAVGAELDTRSPMPSETAVHPVAPTTIGSGPDRVESTSSAKRAVDRHVRVEHQQAGRTREVRTGMTPVSPAPLPALPAPSPGGISTTASGSHDGDGGVAIVSVAVRGGVAAAQCIANATGFAVRRLLVENPIVSPD